MEKLGVKCLSCLLSALWACLLCREEPLLFKAWPFVMLHICSLLVGLFLRSCMAQNDLWTLWTVWLRLCLEAKLRSTVPGAAETATSALGCEGSWVLRDTQAWSYFLLSVIQLKSLGNYWGQYIQLERSVLHLMTALCSRHNSFSSKQYNYSQAGLQFFEWHVLQAA